MTRYLVFGALSAAALAAAACAPPPGADPCEAANREVNLFSLWGNTATGVYDACLEDLRGELARAQLRVRVLQGEATRLDAEAASLEGERAEAARRLAAANRRHSEVLARLDAAREGQNVDRARLNEVLAREDNLARELEALNREGAASAEEADRLSREQDDLMQRIDAMLGMG